jgi:kynurenine formamidase
LRSCLEDTSEQPGAAAQQPAEHTAERPTAASEAAFAADVRVAHNVCDGADDLEAAAERAGARPGPGDVALVRTGWARHFDNPSVYLGQQDGVPGATPEAGRWLAEAGVVAAGADTTAFEQIQPGAGHSVLPVHRILLVEAGIHILEHLALETAAAEGLTEFAFVMAPLRIVGGTGSPIRPVAAVAA